MPTHKRALTALVTIAIATAGCYQAADEELADDYHAPAGDADTDTDGDTDDDGEADETVCGGFDCTDGEPPVVHVDLAVEGGDGLGWQTALASLQQGIDKAQCVATACGTSAQVWVAEGTYYVFIDGPEDTVQLRAGVELFGGFAGDEQALAERALGEHQTVLDGRADPDSVERVRHVVTGSDDSLIDGFTITGGAADGPGPDDSCGGGMLNVDASPVVRYCTFLGNGAGVCGGGALYNRGGAPVVSGCVFTGNGVAGGSGAAIHDSGGSPQISTTVFLSNDAAGDGGALATHGGSVLIETSSFDDNRADGYGGALLGLDGAALVLRGCAFDGNTAQGGGAISTATGSLTAINSTFQDNSAFWGGAIYDLDGQLIEITNSTFTDNYAVEEGGALLQVAGDEPLVTSIVGSIFWDDSPDEIVLYEGTADDTSTEISFNDIAGGGFDEFAGNIDTDPLFSDPAEGVLTLLPDSPCIDRADDSSAPSTDMLGQERVEVENAGYEGTVSDIGALEFQP